LTNAAISGASANPDLDSFPNLFEYAMGLEPKTFDAADTVSTTLSNGLFFPYISSPEGRGGRFANCRSFERLH